MIIRTFQFKNQSYIVKLAGSMVIITEKFGDAFCTVEVPRFLFEEIAKWVVDANEI